MVDSLCLRTICNFQWVVWCMSIVCVDVCEECNELLVNSCIYIQLYFAINSWFPALRTSYKFWRLSWCIASSVLMTLRGGMGYYSTVLSTFNCILQSTVDSLHHEQAVIFDGPVGAYQLFVLMPMRSWRSYYLSVLSMFNCILWSVIDSLHRLHIIILTGRLVHISCFG